MNKFTKGGWEMFNQFSVSIGEGFVTTQHTGILSASVLEREANAHLIATAGTTATKLAEAGYDAVEVLEVLPQLVELVKAVAHIGVDFGYGKYELEPEKIEAARKLLEQSQGG